MRQPVFIFRPSDDFLGTKKIFFIVLDFAAFLTSLKRYWEASGSQLKFGFSPWKSAYLFIIKETKFESLYLILLKVLFFWTGGQILLRASRCDVFAQWKIRLFV